MLPGIPESASTMFYMAAGNAESRSLVPEAVAMKELGNYKELASSNLDGESLVEAARAGSVPLDDEASIIQYLLTAKVMATTGQLLGDVLDSSAGDVSVENIRTDGTWVWPEVLAYYVERYHVSLPPDFVQHVRQVNYTPPVFSEGEMSSIINEYLQI